MPQDASLVLYGRPAILKPSSKQKTRKHDPPTSSRETMLSRHCLEDESEEEADCDEYPGEPTVPQALSTFDGDDLEGSIQHFRNIAEECGTPTQDIDFHIDNMCNILHEQNVFSGRGILSKISDVREAMANEPEILVIINAMFAYLNSVNASYTSEWATWNYHKDKAPTGNLALGGDQHDNIQGKKRPISATGRREQKKINKKVKVLSKKIAPDDDASSLSSSESKEKKPREEAAKLSALFQNYGADAKYLNQKTLPEAKTMVDLAKKTRQYQAGREENGDEGNAPYISSLVLDDEKWIPAYAVQGLTKEKKKEKIKSIQADQGTATLIQQVMTFWTAHIITGACKPEAVLTRVMLSIQNIQQLGVSEARTYEKKLISHFVLKMQQGNPPEDINEDLSNHLDSVDKEVERDSKYLQRLKGKGKGKGDPQKNKSGVIPKWNGDWNNANKYPKSQKQGWGQGQWGQGQYQKNGKAQSYQQKGGKDKSKGNPQNHICFQQDARKGTTCQKQGCKNQHLDTNIAAEAKRFDDAKAIADANWNKKWGNGS